MFCLRATDGKLGRRHEKCEVTNMRSRRNPTKMDMPVLLDENSMLSIERDQKMMHV